MNFKTESGRSMVEMLGTLAIIGVLSIGGIAGYSYGMDKYRCNQTINDISLRRVDLMAQAIQGRSTLSLSEWANESTIYDISNPTYGEGGVIKFDVGATEKIPESVCEMLFDNLSNTATQIDINGSVATSKDSCSDNNTMTFYFSGDGNSSAGTGTGTTGEQCGSTVCGTCQKCENETCMTADDYEMKCSTGGKSGWCISGTCQPEACNCGPNQYCADKNTSDEYPTPSGTCKDVDTQFRTVDIAGTTYYISDDEMSWWDAVSACNVIGSMVSANDFVNGFDSTNGGSQYLTQSSLGTELYNKGWSGSGRILFWINIVLEDGDARSVELYEGGATIGDYPRTGGGYYAVCK